MKIGIDIRPLLESQPSGVGEYTRELLRALFRIDHENEYHLFANSFQLSAFSFQGYPNIFVHHFRYPNKLFNTSLRFFQTPKLDKLISKSYKLDLFFMPNMNFVALSPEVPLMLTVHDLSFEHYPSFFTPKERLWHRMVAPRELVRRAAHLCAVSEHTKNDLVRHYGVSPERITVTYPGVDERFFDELSETVAQSVRQRYDLPGNFILFLGTLGKRKNVQSVIDAFELLKKDRRFIDLHLVLAGRRKKHISNSRELANRSSSPPSIGGVRGGGWKNQIHFLGYVPSADRPALYRLARAFIYPSYYEGFGLPPLEAMAGGTPVIASHASSLGEVVGNAGILVDPHNIEDQSRALEQVLTDPALADELSARGRARAREFTWEKTARATLDLFRVIASEAKQSLLSF